MTLQESASYFFAACLFVCVRNNEIQTPEIPGHGPPPKKVAEKKRLLNYEVSFWLRIPQRPGNIAMMKKNCPRFSKKEGAGAGEQRLKDLA